jgi:hypothetical protein
MERYDEDYVSFEVAKLLKEKGFPQGTFRCHYIIDGNIHYKSFENRCGFGDYDIIAPTLVMAMKWLKEKYNLFIQITVDFSDGAYPMYDVCIIDLAKCTSIIVNGYNRYSYIQACEAGIKYCLENLISIKPQNHWKPNDEQMRALEYIINNASNTSYSCKIAKELLEQLKKLKGE